MKRGFGQAFGLVALLLAQSVGVQPAAAQSLPPDVIAALKEDVARSAIHCAVTLNTPGYNEDGLINFNSFVDNSDAQVKMGGSGETIVFIVRSGNSETAMEVSLSDDLQHVTGFEVVADIISVTRRREGTLLEPRFVDGESRTRTFDMTCRASPRR